MYSRLCSRRGPPSEKYFLNGIFFLLIAPHVVPLMAITLVPIIIIIFLFTFCVENENREKTQVITQYVTCYMNTKQVFLSSERTILQSIMLKLLFSIFRSLLKRVVIFKNITISCAIVGPLQKKINKKK